MKKKYLNIFISIIIIAAVSIALWQMMPERHITDSRMKGNLSENSQTAAIGGSFELQDAHGNVITDKDLLGKYSLVYFGFTYCPDICPTTLLSMTQALKQLGGLGEKVQPVFITLDPERDTAKKLRDYASNFHPDLLVLRGTAEQIDKAAKAYKVFYRKNILDDGDYLVDHSGFAYLMDENGHYVTHFTHEDNAEVMITILTKYLR